MKFALLLFSLGVMLACGNITNPSAALSVSGTWRGTRGSDTVIFMLAQRANDVFGTAFFTASEQLDTVVGSVAGHTVRLTLSPLQDPSVGRRYYFGTAFSSHSMVGEVREDGQKVLALTLERVYRRGPTLDRTNRVVTPKNETHVHVCEWDR